MVCSGDAQIGSNVKPLDPASISSEVWYGKKSGKYTSKQKGNATVYSQLYPFKGLLNYTSGIIHHVRIDGKESFGPSKFSSCFYFQLFSSNKTSCLFLNQIVGISCKSFVETSRLIEMLDYVVVIHSFEFSLRPNSAQVFNQGQSIIIGVEIVQSQL